jgi:hypothetical protein
VSHCKEGVTCQFASRLCDHSVRVVIVVTQVLWISYNVGHITLVNEEIEMSLWCNGNLSNGFACSHRFAVYINFICCVLLFPCTRYSGYSGHCGVRVDSGESSSKMKYLINLESVSIVVETACPDTIHR